MKQIAVRLLILVAPWGLLSCGGLSAIGDSAGSLAKKLPSLPGKESLKAMTEMKWLKGDQPTIAKVRPKDLKKFPLGDERATTIQHNARAMTPMPPVDYTPGMLPPGDVEPTVLLPPM